MAARLCVLTFLAAVSLLARADAPCAVADRGKADPIAFLKQAFESRRYECAAEFASAYGVSNSSLLGRDGIDTRFALREAATVHATDARHPSEARRALAKAAAWTAQSPMPGDVPTEEIHADVRMLHTVAESFFSAAFRGAGQLDPEIKRQELANWLDVLLAAVALDQRLPEDRRALQVYDFQTAAFDQLARMKMYDPLVQLAALLREDKVLRAIRFELARTLYFDGFAWTVSTRREVIDERCRHILKLVELLWDVENCGYQCPPRWYWRPTMNVASAYYRIGMTEDAQRYVQASLVQVRSIEDPNTRLSEYRFAFIDLLALKYDKAILGPLAKEMWHAANTLDTPIAKEVRNSLPKTLERWGRTDLLE